MKRIPTGPVTPRKVQTGPRRGSDTSQYQCSDRSRVPNSSLAIRNRAIEDCAKVAERYTKLRGSFSAGGMARDIAVDIRKLATAPPLPGGTDRKDFPWWAFV